MMVRSAGSYKGYLDQKKLRPPWTLQWDYAWGPMVVLGGLFLMSEVPLHEKPGIGECG